jgi:hypothetical protein
LRFIVKKFFCGSLRTTFNPALIDGVLTLFPVETKTAQAVPGTAGYHPMSADRLLRYRGPIGITGRFRSVFMPQNAKNLDRDHPDDVRPKGRIVGMGRVLRETLHARARALALDAGRDAPHVSQVDYEQAKRELTGESDIDRQATMID